MALLLGSSILGDCGSTTTAAPTTTTTHHPQTYMVDETASDSTVCGHVGETLKVNVQGNPTTGYNWQIRPFIDPWEVLRQQGEPAPPDRGVSHTSHPEAIHWHRNLAPGGIRAGRVFHACGPAGGGTGSLPR